MTRAQTTTELDIGDRQTLVAARGDDASEVQVVLSIGAHHLADDIFRHDPPTPAELEAAIDVVEDQVMTAVDIVTAGSSLVVLGSFAAQIAQACGADGPGSATVDLETIEGLFQRLASESLGNPAARRGLPAGNAFVAGVLILREFMHHHGFGSITIDVH